MDKICRNCSQLERFIPRPDEPSCFGCRAPGWEGYVLDLDKPPCGGVVFLSESSPSTGGKEEKHSVERLSRAIQDTNRDHPLSRCKHGKALRDGAGEVLEPPCGCRSATSPAPRKEEDHG